MVTPAIPPGAPGLRVGVKSNIILAPGGRTYTLNNNRRRQLPKLTAKSAAIRAGIAVQINGAVGPGDSTTTGAGGGTSGTTKLNGAYARNKVSATTAIVNSKGVRCINDNFMGDQFVSTTLGNSAYPAYDPRVTFTGTTAVFPNGTFRALGGCFFWLPAVTDSLTLAASQPWDTAVISLVNCGVGTAALSIDGGVSTAGITGGASISTTNVSKSSFATKVITKAKGTQSLTIGGSVVQGTTVPPNTGTPVLRGVRLYDSTSPAVNLTSLGEYGLRLSQEYATSSFAAAFLADAYDFVIVDMAINDANIGGLAALPAYLTALNDTVIAAKASGADVILFTPNCTNVTAAVFQAYVQGIVDYAIRNDIYLVDINDDMGDYNVANTNGLMDDGLHPKPAGYQVVAMAIAKILTEV